MLRISCLSKQSIFFTKHVGDDIVPNPTHIYFPWLISGLPHTQGIKVNSGNFHIEENIRETQGILIYFLNSGKLREVLIFSKKFREVI